MENFAIQSLVKWLIIKLIPRFIRAFHAHAGLQSYIFFAENQIFSADFRSLRGRGGPGGGHTAARQRVSARSAKRDERKKSAEAQRAAKSPGGRHRESGRTGIRPRGNGSPPVPHQAERKGEKCRGSARRKAPGRTPQRARTDAAKHPDGARQRRHTARQRRTDCSGLARQGRTMRCRGRLSGRSGDSSPSSSSSTSATWSSSIRPSEYSRPR